MPIKTIKLHIIFLLSTVFLSSGAFASHVSGGDVSYTCLGSNSYLVTLNLYRDCSGITLGNTQTISVTNDCGFSTQTLTANLVNNPATGEDFTNVSQLCQADSLNNTCYGGSLPGMQKYTYQVVITLTQQCDSYYFSWGVCCRNSSNNLVGQVSPYFEAALNNANAICNNSPVFTGHPIPYVCVNQPVTYNYGVVEPDGNTLVYSLIDARSSAGAVTPYATGFSGSSPIDGITVDPATGEINFTPNNIGYYVVVLGVTEYDSGGDFIGSSFRDMQFVVQNCSNNVGDYSSLQIASISGDASLDADNNINVCEGASFCFDLTFDDLDVIDVISLSSNVEAVLPGATFNWVSAGSSATATICWTGVAGSPSSSSFTIEVNDNACPITGISYYTKQVNFMEHTSAGSDQLLCDGDDLSLTAIGGTDFTWSLISGDPLVLGTNISCVNCANTIISPVTSSVYQVVSSSSYVGCNTIDTIHVDIVPTFNHTLSPKRDTVCLNEYLSYDSDVSTSGSYTYSWSPGTFLDNTSSADPNVHATVAGAYNHVLSIESSTGCIKKDTVVLIVSTDMAPEVAIALSQDTIHPGDTVASITSVGTGLPTISGLSSTNTCSGSIAAIESGVSVGTNSQTSYPAPYGNWYKNAKHQFLYTADDMAAMGFSGGKITEIGWEITQVNGTTTYHDYTIRMGVTNSTALTGWETGLSTVFAPQVVTIATGWNMHTLTTAYEWDGTSNIVIEICFNNLSAGYTYNSLSSLETTSFVSSLYYRSDGVIACNATSFSTSSNRPLTRFQTCDVGVDISDYNFSWTPAGALSDPTVIEPLMHATATTTYNLETTNMVTGCKSNDVTTLIVITNPFPIELLYFDAIPDHRFNKVDLNWTTMSETNNNFFEIQRSENGMNWHSIAQISGAGTSVNEKNYTSTDNQPLHGVSYYRLKQVDFDGAQTFSPIQAVQFNNQISFSPNPTTGVVRLIAEEYLTTEVELLDANGRLVHKETLRGSSSINFSHLPKGMYVFKTFANEKVTFDKLILK